MEQMISYFATMQGEGGKQEASEFWLQSKRLNLER